MGNQREWPFPLEILAKKPYLHRYSFLFSHFTGSTTIHCTICIAPLAPCSMMKYVVSPNHVCCCKLYNPGSHSKKVDFVQKEHGCPIPFCLRKILCCSFLLKILTSFSIQMESPLGFPDSSLVSVVSISTDVRRRASTTSIRDIGYFFPKFKELNKQGKKDTLIPSPTLLKLAAYFKLY